MYQDLCSWDNLFSAYHKASKAKRGHPNVAAFEYRLEDNLLQLQKELAGRTYTPGPYHSFYIHEPKRRLISAAPFRDRVVHHALCNLIEPRFERSFIFDSYANRKGKGTHRALDRAQEFSRRFPYVLQCDIRQYFPSIDHILLRDILSRKLDDPDILGLIDLILGSGRGVLAEEYTMIYFEGDDLFAVNRPRGLPIGNLTSQFWANCYLNPFDHFVKRELGCRGYVRYVDDFLLFAHDKRELARWRSALIQRLAQLRVTLHAGAAQIRPVREGISFLGLRVFPAHRRLKSRVGFAARRRLTRLWRAYRAHQIGFDRFDASVRGWVNHARYGDTMQLRRAVLTNVMSQIKQTTG